MERQEVNQHICSLNDKIKRLKELETLQKTGILTEQEFEKLKIDLLK